MIMKVISNYILEKLHLTKDINSGKYVFKSHITDNPHKFKNYNYLLSGSEWKKNRYAILTEYVGEIVNDGLLAGDDLKFAEKFLKDLKKIYKTCYTNEFGYLVAPDYDITDCINGEKPYFGTAKFIYDVLNYALTKKDLTTPRRQKIEKWLNSFTFEDVEKHKDEMNWY